MSYLCSVIELLTRFVETVRFQVVGQSIACQIANHLADVHQLDNRQRRQYLQEARLQPKVKVVVYESKADNSRKTHGTTTCNPVETQETVYKLLQDHKEF